MPELPEVETIRRQLEPDLNGRIIEVVEVLDPYFTKPESPANFERAVNGREIVDVGRRGKYLMLELDDGMTVVIHLRMTGSLVLLAPDGSENPGDARIYATEQGEKHLKARFTLDGSAAALSRMPKTWTPTSPPGSGSSRFRTSSRSRRWPR